MYVFCKVLLFGVSEDVLGFIRMLRAAGGLVVSSPEHIQVITEKVIGKGVS